MYSKNEEDGCGGGGGGGGKTSGQCSPRPVLDGPAYINDKRDPVPVGSVGKEFKIQQLQARIRYTFHEDTLGWAKKSS